MPENQTAWNCDNHRIEETVKQNNQTGKAADREARQWTMWAGLAVVREQAAWEGLT